MIEKLNNGFLVFDGAMGTMLQKIGLKTGEYPEIYNVERPEIIYDIHKQYIEAGADIITTNTFGANRYKLKDTPYSVDEIISNGVAIARKAAKDKYVALDIGPIGAMLSPIGTLSFDVAYDIFKEQVIIGKRCGADLILIETMSDLYEVKAAILAAKENTNLPVFCTMTFNDNKRTFTGTDPITMANVIEGLGVDALGINCSLGPNEVQRIVDDMLKYASVPIIVQPNAGLPKIIDGNTVFDLTEDEFSIEIGKMAEKGALIFGGCCGTNPEFIKKIKKILSTMEPNRPTTKRITCTCSSTKTVVIGEEVKVIGERINPTGKKKLKQALRENNIEYIIKEAILQNESGSDILDINMGLLGINENEMMKKVVTEIQQIIDAPLQIDSMKKEVIEEAVRIYNGKPIINSVNGKQSSMRDIFPIAKKYGALVIGLTLDEEGIPKTAEKRLEIAEKIISNAKSYGIPEENILIDPLVLCASSEQGVILETLKSIPLIKSKFNVKTVLGTSNVSFGLPNRKIINTTYLAMALSYGLDAPITDSTTEEIMDTIRSFRVLLNQDKDCREFTSVYGNKKNKENVKVINSNISLKNIIIKGLKEESSKKTGELLNKLEPMDIVDTYIIPALDLVGEKYEAEEIFLPQLIRSAETVKNAFEIIKDKLIKEGKQKVSKGRIVLATVEGDIHDIGKNIVKLLLENYGFEVIDLGKDVAIEKVVETVNKYNIKLVGLSALMTTTVENMEKTIKALRDNNTETKIMVGGAVLTNKYANLIGSNYYAKDAKMAVEIARKVFDFEHSKKLI